MRSLLFCLLIILFGGKNHILGQDKEVNFSDPQTWLLGYFDPDDLLREPHYQWFSEGFDSYDADGEIILQISETDLDSVKVLVVLGTWCPDSRREVPRFIKLCQLIGLREENLSMIGTDSYKEAPVDNYDKLDIERVPTFIFYSNKNELGRIIEYPQASLERDMLDILKELEK